MPEAPPVERFHPTSGQAVGWAGLVLLCAGAVYVVAAEPGRTSLRVALAMLLASAVVWVAMLRPRAEVRHHDAALVLRNPLTDTFVPLALVDRVTVRQTLDVHVDDDCYRCIGIGLSVRQSMRRRKRGAAAAPRTGMPDPGQAYADFVVWRVDTLAREARGAVRGGGQVPPVRRRWAVPEVTVLATLAVALVAALLLV